MNMHIILWLTETATKAYIAYFHNEFKKKHPTLGSELALMSDETAIAALISLSESHLFAWPSDTHPNYEFVNIFLSYVDWHVVLGNLRMEQPNV